jgi:signal transduction histidine kinase
MVPTEVLTEVARASGAPVYTFADATIGSGVVGGAMWRHDNEAVQTARLAVRVLRGATGAALPGVEDAPTPYMADWRELQRFGLDERRLPPGTEVLHRAPSVWERYRGIALATFAVVLLEALLIGLLLDERRRRLRAQDAIADQARYEHMLAHLMTDAARYAPLATPGALEDALGRIGRYAGADDVMLLQHSAIASRPPTRLQWHRWKSSASAQPTDASASSENGQTLEFPLVVADRSLGVLKLSRAGSATPWPPQLMERLAAAADVLAVAITRLAATQRAEEAAHQVAHIGRVAMIGELASTISHELRQPLAAILINGETGKQLLARKPDAPMLDRVFDDIIADTNRATGVIEHIRSLLRNEVLPNAMIDVNAICREAVDLLRHDALKRGIQLDVSFDSRLSPVAGQPIELQQVVLNLLLNAFDAVMSGSERSVAIRTSALERSVQIMVRDSGPGLSTEATHHVFESFFTTKAQGLGMGLAIVRSIVERHRGRIQLETGEQRGAIFRVILPAIDVPATETAPRRDLVEASGR